MTGSGFSVLDSGSAGGRFTGSSHIRGPTWLNLPILTICLLGVQISWSVEMSNASPYLLSLGLSKSAMAVVFVAGPLSGLIVQPLIGVLADNNTSKWGRRRPYMIMGTVVCAGALLLLGWTKVVAGWFGQADSPLVVVFAVLSIYVIDFSINAVQAMDRALVVDILPSSLQPAGNAWAAKMLAIGNLVGFFVGNLDLPLRFPFLGSTQLQVLSLIGSFVLISSHLATASMVREKILLEKSQSGHVGPIQKFVQELKDIWINMLTLPRVIRQICLIQFFAWLGWFPVLFYTSVYVGDLNKRVFYATATVIPPTGSSSSAMTPEILASLDAESSRLGSRALFYSSLLTLVMNFVLPYFVTEASTNSRRRKQRRHQQTVSNGFGSSHGSNGPLGGGMNGSSGYTSDALNRGRGLLRRVTAFAIPERMQVHLSSLWAMGHAMFALCMLGTFFTSSVSGASVLIAITGFSWAVTQWVPFALLGEAILTEPSAFADDHGSIQLADTRHRRRSASINLSRASSESRRELSMLRPDIDSRGGTFTIEDESDDDQDERDGNKKGDQRMRSTLFGNAAAGVSKIDISRRQDNRQYPDDDANDGEEAELVGRARDEEDLGTSDGIEVTNGGGLSAKAGIILGIHNIFIVIPQFLVTGISSIIFALFDPSKSVLHGRRPGNIDRAMNITEVPRAVNELSQLLFLRNATNDQEALLDEILELEEAAKSNSVVYIFRLGGVAAFVAFILCWRLSRELRHR